MSIKSVCTKYFDSFSPGKAQYKATPKQKFVAGLCIASCVLVFPPVIFGIGLGLSKVSDCARKITHKVKSYAVKHPNSKIGKIRKIFFKNYPVVDTVAGLQHKNGLFVAVLNKRGYRLNNKNVTFPKAGKPVEYTSLATFDQSLKALQDKYGITGNAQVMNQFIDNTTEEAIAQSTHFPIALNFANPDRPGGSPGFHKDVATGNFVFDHPSARAQEESICQRSTAIPSLIQLPITVAKFPSRDPRLPDMVDYTYSNPLQSKTHAYVSDNHLFAVAGQDFYQSQYLAKPKAMAIVTTAAQPQGQFVDCNPGSNDYIDTRQRIETHLLAAADKAGEIKTRKISQSVELITGAFGCGVFAPQHNPNEYRQMVAEIYKEILPKFNGFFDVVTFAVPTFGRLNPRNPDMRDPSIANHEIFKNVLKFPAAAAQQQQSPNQGPAAQQQQQKQQIPGGPARGPTTQQKAPYNSTPEQELARQQQYQAYVARQKQQQ